MVRMDHRGGTWKLLGSVVYAHSKVGLGKHLHSCKFTIITGRGDDESEEPEGRINWVAANILQQLAGSFNPLTQRRFFTTVMEACRL